MCKKKGRLYAKAKKNTAHWQKFVDHQKATQRALNQAHWKYVNGILTQGLEEGNQKTYWRYIRSQKQDNQGVSPLRSGNQLHSDAQTKAELLSRQFSSVSLLKILALRTLSYMDQHTHPSVISTSQ